MALCLAALTACAGEAAVPATAPQTTAPTTTTPPPTTIPAPTSDSLTLSLVQRIANSWELEYGLMQRLDPLNNGKNSLGFQLRARLFKF